jgi:hypothetical protein
MQVLVMPHAVAVAANVHDVAVMDEAIDQRGGHHLIAEDLAPLREALVRGEHGTRPLIASGHELKEQHGAGP